MKILFVYKEDYPWDVRVEKIVDSLLGADHEVTLISANRRNRTNRETAGRLNIRRLSRVIGPLRAAWNLPTSVNLIWVSELEAAMRQVQPDLVIVRDIPLAPAVVRLGHAHGASVVLDMAECYPALYSLMREVGDQPHWCGFMKDPRLASWIESYSVHGSEHTMTVVEESRDRLISLGHDPDQISVVSNTPRHIERALTPHQHSDGGLRLVYIGFVERVRGIDLALRGIAEFVSRSPSAEIHLDIIGEGSARRELESLATALGIVGHVEFHGRLPYAEAKELLAASNVGLIPHVVSEAWHRTVSNKLFDYMMWGMPVLSSRTKPTARILSEEDCGMVFDDPISFSAALATLSRPPIRQRLGDNGRKAIRRRYNWGRDERELLRVVESLERACHKSGGPRR